MKLHCVRCNCLWGSGDFKESSGICPTCFTEWINSKKKIECYGMYNADTSCNNCRLMPLCFKDTYGIE